MSATFVLSVEVQNDTASITSSKDIHTQLDAKTQFLLALLGGPAFGWFSGLAIEKQLQSLTNKNLALLPTQIALPNGEEQVLVWKTTGAQFNRTIYNGKATPVLSVIREFNIESPAACVLHKEIQKMQIQ